MAKKSTGKKNSKATKVNAFNSDDLSTNIPSRVTNKLIFEHLVGMERRMVRIEKLVLMLLDESFFKRDEKAKVAHVEKLLNEGKFDELDELMKKNY